MDQDIDYPALFAAAPTPYLLLDSALVIRDVNRAYLHATGRTRTELIGRRMFDAFPDNPFEPAANGVRNLEASLRRALATGEPDTMALQRYDIPVTGNGAGTFEERWWSPINVPVATAQGTMLIHRVTDVTAFVRERERRRGHRLTLDRLRRRADEMEAELFARGRELQEVNERLRVSLEGERKVALALQRAMLPPSATHAQGMTITARYRPGVSSLQVAGDWYDLVDLEEGRASVAVGDVVGKGLRAAAVMGQLRSALSAAVRATGRPGRALEVLERHAATIDGAAGTTAVEVIVDQPARRITYSRAGHPPPLLVAPDEAPVLLDEATGPPLGTDLEPRARPEATVPFPPGARLVLYTDGLVERRGASLLAGIERLAGVVERHAALDAGALADAVVAELLEDGPALDDVVLVVVGL